MPGSRPEPPAVVTLHASVALFPLAPSSRAAIAELIDNLQGDPQVLLKRRPLLIWPRLPAPAGTGSFFARGWAECFIEQ